MFFYHTLSLSLNELPSDYWGLWRSIKNMCGGLEAADGKSFVKRLTLISPREPEPAGKKNSQRVQREKLIGFLQDIIFHRMDKQENTSHPKPISVKYRSQLENWIIRSPLGTTFNHRQSGFKPVIVLLSVSV